MTEVVDLELLLEEMELGVELLGHQALCVVGPWMIAIADPRTGRIES